MAALSSDRISEWIPPLFSSRVSSTAGAESSPARFDIYEDMLGLARRAMEKKRRAMDEVFHNYKQLFAALLGNNKKLVARIAAAHTKICFAGSGAHIATTSRTPSASGSSVGSGSSTTNTSGTGGSKNTALPIVGSGSGGGFSGGVGGCGSGGGSGPLPPPAPSPPPPPPPTHHVPEGSPSLARLWAHLGYGGTLLVGIANDLPQLVQTWGTAPRVVYIGMMVVAAGVLVTALQTSGRRSGACARLGSGLCTGMLVVDISCKAGRRGWIAGVACGSVIGAISTATWINEEAAARQAVAKLCRQAAEGASTLWGRVVGLWRRLKKPASATAASVLPIRQIQLTLIRAFIW